MNEDTEVRQSKRKEKVLALQTIEKDSTRKTMDTREGRLLIWRILEKTGYQSLSYTGNSETFFKEGRRSIGLQIYAELMGVCPELYWKMVQENVIKEKANA